MRAQSSVKIASSLVVVGLALVSGCSPDEPRVVAVVPEPPEPEPDLRQPELELLEPGQRPAVRQTQELVNAIREVQVQQLLSHSDVVPPRAWRTLVFECPDAVRFEVRTSDNGLQLFPPRFPPGGFLVLGQVPSDSGALHYRNGDIDLRIKDDLATLQIGRKRYIDCVSNPAAAVWQAPRRSTTPR